MWAVASFTALLAAIVGHAGLRRAAPRLGSVIGFLAMGSLIGAGLAVLLLLRWGWAVETWAVLACYAFACELYIFLFCSISSSISASLLYRLRLGAVCRADMEAHRTGHAMVQRRLSRMVSARLLEPSEGGYRPTASGLRLAQAFRRMRIFFRRQAATMPRAT
jgi:hypothetical protein